MNNQSLTEKERDDKMKKIMDRIMELESQWEEKSKGPAGRYEK
jgi:hypothetical protein